MLEYHEEKVGFWHVIHFVLTVFTYFWIIVWITHVCRVSSRNKKERERVKIQALVNLNNKFQ